MKKAIAIIILGLLWCNVGFAGSKKPIYLTVTVKHVAHDKMYTFGGKYRWDHAHTIPGSVNFNALKKCTNENSANPKGCLIYKVTTKYSDGTSSTTRQWSKNYQKYKSAGKPKEVVKKPEDKESDKSPDNDKVVAASMGSGFFVTRAGHLVTNYHVIEECNAVKTNILGKEIRTDIIAIDKTNDLAIIKAEMKPSKVFPVSNKDVSLLQDVIVAGFPLGKSVSAVIKTHKGSVTALAGFGDNYSNFQTDATINQGNSGGPIMDLKGNVVGVAVQLISAEHAQNVFFGVKSSTLKTFANANSIKFLPPNNREMSNEDLGQLVTEATVFLECWMTVAKIKQIIAQEENRKAFYSEHK